MGSYRIEKATDSVGQDAGDESSNLASGRDDSVGHLYLSDEYIDKYPTLFEEDTPWKVQKIAPLINVWVEGLGSDQNEVTLLDVGGGAGLLLRAVGLQIQQGHHRLVRKYALDLSPGMLNIQRRNNPDLTEALNQDITATTVPEKSIDLTLMIDVLEHVPDPVAALREARRISHNVILKVPLEDHLVNNLTNFLNHGRTRQAHRESLGHVNFYTAGRLKREVENNLGTILRFDYTNSFQYVLKSESHTMPRHIRAVNHLCATLFRFSPRIASWIFTDFAVMLVRCD